MVKINVSMDGRSKQFEGVIDGLKGKKIGDIIKGSITGVKELEGYELKITGGTDNAGFPMRADISGSARKRILTGKGVGMRKSPEKGFRRRKTVAGNMIYEGTAQINVVVVKKGKIDIFASVEKEGEKEGKIVEEKKSDKEEKKEMKEVAKKETKDDIKEKEKGDGKEEKKENKEEVKKGEDGGGRDDTEKNTHEKEEKKEGEEQGEEEKEE